MYIILLMQIIQKVSTWLSNKVCLSLLSVDSNLSSSSGSLSTSDDSAVSGDKAEESASEIESVASKSYTNLISNMVQGKLI